MTISALAHPVEKQLMEAMLGINIQKAVSLPIVQLIKTYT